MSRDMKDRPIEDLQAGDAFRRSLLDRADARRSGAPLWHGWALMDAFLAGLDHARAATPDNSLTDPSTMPLEDRE